MSSWSSLARCSSRAASGARETAATASRRRASARSSRLAPLSSSPRSGTGPARTRPTPAARICCSHPRPGSVVSLRSRDGRLRDRGRHPAAPPQGGDTGTDPRDAHSIGARGLGTHYPTEFSAVPRSGPSQRLCSGRRLSAVHCTSSPTGPEHSTTGSPTRCADPATHANSCTGRLISGRRRNSDSSWLRARSECRAQSATCKRGKQQQLRARVRPPARARPRRIRARRSSRRGIRARQSLASVLCQQGRRRTIRHARRMTASYPRRQQLRRLRRAGARALQAAFALAAALMLAWTGEAALATAAVLLAAVLSVDGAHALRLAARSRVGAESEAEVRCALEPLTRDGWRVQHAVDWPAEAISITSFAPRRGSAS